MQVSRQSAREASGPPPGPGWRGAGYHRIVCFPAWPLWRRFIAVLGALTIALTLFASGISLLTANIGFVVLSHHILQR